MSAQVPSDARTDHVSLMSHDSGAGAVPPGRMRTAMICAVAAVVLGAAIFGFFFAWVCSTMWGLDAADPRVAIAAMQAMNDSVQNAVFFPAFFLTPVVMAAAALLARRSRRPRAAAYLLAAGLVYLAGGLLLTMLVNVPMNEELAGVSVPQDIAEAARVWSDYSGSWQSWNVTRTVFSGIAVALATIGVHALGRGPRAASGVAATQ
ncbi:DUF1772 domain-containing protein [Georgenia sp. Z1344]|uniref:anthrone oxygenase family protein n=1 Tax=Georgenia sp. Z1344 TaxID=3416706 RepID=UPI003CF3909D